MVWRYRSACYVSHNPRAGRTQLRYPVQSASSAPTLMSTAPAIREVRRNDTQVSTVAGADILPQ